MNAAPSTRRLPQWLKVLLAVVLGAALGAVFGTDGTLLGLNTEDLGRLGMLVIRALKALAVPLVFFTVVDAILRYAVQPSRFGKLVAVCALNAAVALGIGLTIVQLVQPGHRLAPHFRDAMAAAPPASAAYDDIDVIAGLEALVPKTVVEPLVSGNVLGAVVLALLFGFALRKVRDAAAPGEDDKVHAVERVVRSVCEALFRGLGWLVSLVPFAALALVAHAVGKSGLRVFADLWPLATVIAVAMLLHAGVWYPLIAWFVGRKSPRTYFGCAAEAVVAGVATNSSLATVPVTLACLGAMKVSPESSRLAACVGTNLNNDGITLYEVIAALVIAQACGLELGLGAQAAIAAAALLASMGIAGVPEAGLVILPMVLGVAGLPDAAIAVAIPLVVSIDWLLARARTVLNVLSDMAVAVAIDRDVEPT